MESSRISKTMRIELAPEGDVSPAGPLPSKTPSRTADLVLDSDGQILDASPALLSRLERRLDDVRNKPVSSLIPGFDHSVLAAIKTEIPAMPVHISAVCGRRGGHSTLLNLEAFSDANTSSGTICFAALSDEMAPSALEHRLIQTRLDRAERLETAGTVAGQIAHDFNNLLTPLIAYPQLIRKALPPDSPALEFLNLMEKTSKDMSHLTQQLLSLSRRGQIGREIYNVDELIDRVVGLLASTLPPGIVIRHQKIDRPMDVKGSREQLLRVIQNICQNAIDAMGETGTLTILTENIYLDAPFGQYEMVNTGEYVKISFIDTGCGIPDEIKDRIFDPFFTTKKADKKRGSGLGLSIVHGIVKDHGGYIDLESQVARGTTFYVYIPTHREVPTGEPSKPEHPNTGRILVIDDDTIQVTLLCDMLKSSGFQAIGAHSGEEGIRLLKERHGPIDLVLLDLVMFPGMDGLDTFRSIHRLFPKLPVLLMSGYTHAAPKVQQAQTEGAGEYLAKPIEQTLLASKVCQILNIPLPRLSPEPVPVKPKAPAAGVPQAAPGASPQKRRILLADDDKLIRKLFALIISTEFPNSTIDQAANGEEAVNLFKTEPYDLLVMDLQMPRIAGREAALEIQHHCVQQNIPEPIIIFCTGFAPPESLSQIVGDGTRHTILRKPVRVDDLIAAIHARI